MPKSRRIALTAFAMLPLAASSWLCRAALRDHPVSHSSHSTPWNLRMPISKRRGQMLGGLADNLETSHERALQSRVTQKLCTIEPALAPSR
jgi:hypothetical protein